MKSRDPVVPPLCLVCLLPHNRQRRSFLKIVGDVTVSDTITRENTADNNGFTLTCTSTGGPATTVTWTRGSETVTEGTETVLDDQVTAQYTHTLTGSTAGVYTCTVANRKPSSDSANITVEGMDYLIKKNMFLYCVMNQYSVFCPILH